MGICYSQQQYAQEEFTQDELAQLQIIGYNRQFLQVIYTLIASAKSMSLESSDGQKMELLSKKEHLLISSFKENQMVIQQLYIGFKSLSQEKKKRELPKLYLASMFSLFNVVVVYETIKPIICNFTGEQGFLKIEQQVKSLFSLSLTWKEVYIKSISALPTRIPDWQQRVNEFKKTIGIIEV